MPSPNSQNLRSAPQKQPRPNTARSRPSGYGPFRGRPLTKCCLAVGIAFGRPGSASPGAGIETFFLNMNMAGSIGAGPNIRPRAAFRTAGPHHVLANADAGGVTPT